MKLKAKSKTPRKTETPTDTNIVTMVKIIACLLVGQLA
jgi:hypothetical protein